ncbi:MAG: hypothetical protein ACLTVB_08610, partial [Sutterella sp.]
MSEKLYSRPLLSETRQRDLCESRACGILLDISRQRLTNDDFEQLKSLYESKEVHKNFLCMVK